MIERYRSELNGISGNSLWKESLKQNLQRKKEKRNLSAAALAFAACFLIILNQVNRHLPLLILEQERETVEFGGLGEIGNLGSDSSLLIHNDPYSCDQNQGILPVYENLAIEEEHYLYQADQNELLEILIQGAEKIGYTDYDIEYLEADPYLINSPVYLTSDFGKLDLFSKNTMQLRINEALHLKIEGDSQQEKMESVQEFIAENRNFFPYTDPYIDVYLISNYGFKKWGIRICEKGDSQEETLVHYQLNYIEIIENEKNEIDSFLYQNSDLSRLIGNYPIKTAKEASQGMNQEYEYVEMVYEINGKLILPYYKFYIKNQQGILETRLVCAIADRYIKFENQD